MKEKDREIYAEIKAIPPLIIRLDGRNFKRALSGFKKPYDEKFTAGMVKAVEIFFENSGFNPELAYIFSDEISIFFDKVLFKGRVEKLDSVISGFLSSALTLVLDLKMPISFDARVIPICKENILEYLTWRQAEAWRNHINAYGYYTLREEGLSENEAEERMNGMKAEDVHEMLFSRGINLNATPKWQRRGILIAKERYEKEGFNPKESKKVIALRYKVVQLWNLPLFKSEEGRDLIFKLIV
jgi:tRNA(His) 5'-end guanylyltransferase